MVRALPNRCTSAALRNVVRVPHLYAIAAAGVVMLTGTTVPEPLMRAVGLLNDAALPMMVLLMGLQLERTAFPERPALVGLATAVRLAVLPLLALGLAAVFGLTGADRQAAVIQASMPAAVMITVLAGEESWKAGWQAAAQVQCLHGLPDRWPWLPRR